MLNALRNWIYIRSNADEYTLAPSLNKNVASIAEAASAPVASN
jgi:hypothetical protein